MGSSSLAFGGKRLWSLCSHVATPVAIVFGRLFEVLKSSCGLLLEFGPAGQRVFRHMGPHGLGVGSVLIGGFQQVRSMSAGSFPGLSNLELAISLEGTPTGGVHF